MNSKSSTLYPQVKASDVILSEQGTILDAVATIDRTDARIALIVDSAGKLVGSVTDGDIRRGLLRGKSLQSPLADIMHTAPHALPLDTPRDSILGMMEAAGIRQIPLLDKNGIIASIVTYEELLGQRHALRPNPVVVMAGGKGRRLLPLTSDIPKPMVQIGNKPILEWIIKRLQHQGFHDFHLAVNYLGHVIEQYFGDGSRFECSISYTREKEFMGTAGALSLLEQKFSHPLVVTNGDILASIDFGDVVDFHTSHTAVATVCARSHNVQVPYGVLQTENGMLKAIEEKPVYEDLISAGMYVLDPEVLATIPKDSPTDMPSVLTALVKDKKKVAVYTLQDEWRDIGHRDELEQVRQQFAAG
ncbi:MAG: nucleotidyltransferase family protein [Alphaproteobacteria bacterium]